MELQCQSRMLPALFRRCTALSISSPCQQLVSLAAFRTHRLLSEPLVGSSIVSCTDSAASGSNRRDIRVFSRKRNIFLDPAARDENLNSLTVRAAVFVIKFENRHQMRDLYNNIYAYANTSLLSFYYIVGTVWQ